MSDPYSGYTAMHWAAKVIQIFTHRFLRLKTVFGIWIVHRTTF